MSVEELNDGLGDLEAQLEQQATTTTPSRPTESGSETPSLYDCVQAKQDWGLEGERNSFLVLLLTAAGGGGMVCMTGLSRSGKDFITDAMMALFPDDRDVYEVPNSGEEAAFYRRANLMNMSRVHRYMDVVNLDDHIEDVLKHHGTGDEASREINVQNDEGEWIPTTMTIDVPEAIIYFLASDNSQVDLNDFPELRNRSLVISTDASQGLSEEIQYRQGQEVAMTYEPNLSESEIMAIRDHVGSIPYASFDTSFDSSDIYNPCGEAITENHPIPSWFVESRHDSKRLFKFINISTLWNHKERMVEPVTDQYGNEAERMFVTPKDVWFAMRVFGEKLVMSALSLRDLDKRVLWYLRENVQPHTVSTVTQILKQAGFNVTPRDVRNACDNLANKSYVQKNDDSGKVEYQALPFATDIDEYQTLDYEYMIEDACRVVDDRVRAENLSADVADRYKQNIRSDTTAVHPITGEEVDITEYQGFKKQIEQREEELESMLGTSVYEQQASSSGSSDDSDEGQEGSASTASGLANFGGS